MPRWRRRRASQLEAAEPPDVTSCGRPWLVAVVVVVVVVVVVMVLVDMQGSRPRWARLRTCRRMTAALPPDRRSAAGPRAGWIKFVRPKTTPAFLAT